MLSGLLLGMQDLGTLGGDSSQAYGINDNGQVVGVSTLADGVTSHAFLWTEDTGMVDLGDTGRKLLHSLGNQLRR